jgi:O-antigen/teichoic acid export membrane protein
LSIGDRAVRGSIALSIGSIVSLVVAAVGSVVIARILGPDNYGLISVIMVAPNILMVLSDLGVSTAITRYAPMKGYGNPYIVTGIAMKVIAGAVASATLALLAGPIASALGRPYVEPYIRLAAVLVVASSAVSAATSALIGLGGYLISAGIQASLTALRVLVGAGLVILGFGVLGAVLGHVVAWSALALVSLAVLLHRIGLHSTPSLRVAREIVAYSTPLYLPALLGIPLSQLYYSILVRASTNWDLGNLGVAGNLMAVIGSIGGAISTSLLSSFPLLLGDKDSLSRAVEKSITYTALIMPAIAGGVIVVAKPLLLTLYGHSYSMSPLYASLLALGIMIAPLGHYVWSPYMASIGRTDVLLKAGILGALTGIPVYVTLTLTVGVVGYIVAGIINSLIITLYLLKVALSIGTHVNLRPAFKMITPTVIALTTATPLLMAENTITSWILAPIVYAAILALVTPVIVGPEVLAEITAVLRRAGFIGSLIALAINIDVKVAEKIWGLEGRRS